MPASQGDVPPSARSDRESPHAPDTTTQWEPSMASGVIVRPLAPRRPPLTVIDRIAALRSIVDDEFWAPHRVNITTVINLYEAEQLRYGDIVYVQSGQVFKEMPSFLPGQPIWREGQESIMVQYTQQQPAFAGVACPTSTR